LCGSCWLLQTGQSFPPSLLNEPRHLWVFLFHKMKLRLMLRLFDGIEIIQSKSQDLMKMLTRNFFQQCFRS
jgi:hypothetical protein